MNAQQYKMTDNIKNGQESGSDSIFQAGQIQTEAKSNQSHCNTALLLYNIEVC